MKITVNGEPKTVEGMSLLNLLESLDIAPTRVAVELNMEILPKGEYATTLLNDGDVIEIVHFVGGGQNWDRGTQASSITHDPMVRQRRQ